MSPRPDHVAASRGLVPLARLKPMPRFYLLLLLSLAAITGCVWSRTHRARAASAEPGQSHVAWVSDALVRMQTIKPGMTRKDLLDIFTTEGGLSTALRRTYVSRDCPYFKIDVEFEAVGRAGRDRDGRTTAIEDGRDIIVSISKPYLAFSIAD
jgi:hypothetical protein